MGYKQVKIYFDIDGTLLAGPPSLFSLWQAFRSRKSSSRFTLAKQKENILDRWKFTRNLTKIFLGIRHTGSFRKPNKNTISVLEALAEKYDRQSLFILSGRSREDLEEVTLDTLKHYSLLKFFLDKDNKRVFLRDKEFSSSAWKSKILAKEDGIQKILVENDLFSAVKIAKATPDVIVLVYESLETNPRVRSWINLVQTPENVLLFSDFKQLPQLITSQTK